MNDVPRTKVPRSFLLLEIVIVVPLTLLICLWNLNGASFHHVDESYHVRVTQEFLMGNSYFTPKSFGKTYYNKPPLKMWLTVLPVRLLGESNFSYRLIDGLCGVATVLLTYFAARLLLASRVAGLVAVLLLLGSRTYIFMHGVRSANQDSMLVMLVTAAMIVGWKLFEALREDRPSFLLALLLGLLCGSAVLTKSVAGLLPFPMLAIFGLLSSDRKLLLTKKAIALGALSLVATLCLPLLYIVPMYLKDPDIFEVMFRQEVLKRATEGYHNVSNVWFYYTRLMKDAGSAPPMIVAGAFLIGIAGALTHKRSYLFLLCWAAFPILFFTAIPSRLPWYIAPAFPAIALLGGALLSAATSLAVELAKKQTSRGFLLAAPPTLFVLVASYQIEQHLEFVVDRVLHPRGRLSFDRVVTDIQEFSEARAIKANTVLFQDPFLSRNEYIYRDMLPSRSVIHSLEELQREIQGSRVDFILAEASALPKLAPLFPFAMYRFLPPSAHRKSWGVVLSAHAAPELDNFLSVTEKIDVGGTSIEPLFGWSTPGVGSGITSRPIMSSSAGLLLTGDYARKALPTILRVRLSAARGVNEIALLLNDSPIGSFQPSRGFSIHELHIPEGRWQSGKNALFFHVTGGTGDGPKVLVDCLEVSLAPENRE